MGLLERMKSSGSIKSSSLKDSDLFNVKDTVQTQVPIINIALSARVDGGLSSGLTFIAGPSRNFKSLLGLVLVKSYMSKYEDSVCLFYDTEFGITPEYAKANDINMDRVIHIPILNVEEIKFDIAKRLDEIKRGDKVIIFIDSIGNVASKKEVEDALDEKSVTDMTRAKSLKSLWRIVTPHLTIKDIPCVVINHTYKEQGTMYPKDVMGGGTGGMYSSNQVFIISKSQEKEGTELVGNNFTINIEKSRFVKEKSKFKFTVTWKDGISKYSGLLDIALESQHVLKPSNGWYSKLNKQTGEIEPKKRLSATMNAEFWDSILNDVEFQEFVKEKYGVSYGSLLSEEHVSGVEVCDDEDEDDV